MNISELKSKLAELKKDEDKAYKAYKTEEKKLTDAWLSLSRQVDALEKEIEKAEMREAARAEVLAEIQAQQAQVVPTSTPTEQVKV